MSNNFSENLVVYEIMWNNEMQRHVCFVICSNDCVKCIAFMFWVFQPMFWLLKMCCVRLCVVRDWHFLSARWAIHQFYIVCMHSLSRYSRPVICTSVCDIQQASDRCCGSVYRQDLWNWNIWLPPTAVFINLTTTWLYGVFLENWFFPQLLKNCPAVYEISQFH